MTPAVAAAAVVTLVVGAVLLHLVWGPVSRLLDWAARRRVTAQVGSSQQADPSAAEWRVQLALRDRQYRRFKRARRMWTRSTAR